MSRFGNHHDRIRDEFKNKVPWRSGTETSYVKFSTVPRGSLKSKVHVSFLSFTETSFPGEGIYLGDTFVTLGASSLLALLARTIQVRPRAQQLGRLTCFGWECDRPMVNGVISFIIGSPCGLGVCTRAAFAAAFVRALGKISATYTKHDHNSNRLLQSLVDSEAMRFANRTICDPVFFAQEFNRCELNHAHVKGFVKLHRQ
jgi:hypothetical protein